MYLQRDFDKFRLANGIVNLAIQDLFCLALGKKVKRRHVHAYNQSFIRIIIIRIIILSIKILPVVGAWYTTWKISTLEEETVNPDDLPDK